MRLWDGDSPSRFMLMPRSRYVLTVEGTEAHGALPMTVKDSGKQFTVTPQDGWWSWLIGNSAWTRNCQSPCAPHPFPSAKFYAPGKQEFAVLTANSSGSLPRR